MSIKFIPPDKKFENMSLMEKVQVYREIAFFPAVTVMIFLRRKIGYRKLSPVMLLAMTIILLVLPMFLNSVGKDLDLAMMLYAIGMFAYAHFSRWLRWGEITRGERWHSYSVGVSYFEALPLPDFLKCNRRIYRFLDPLAAFIVGLIVIKCGAHVLGEWLLFAAVCLSVSEELLYERIINDNLDVLDGLIDSEVQQEIFQQFQQPQAGQIQLKLDDTAGIPTGLSPELTKQIELRKARRAKAQQENPPPAENLDKDKPNIF